MPTMLLSKKYQIEDCKNYFIFLILFRNIEKVPPAAQVKELLTTTNKDYYIVMDKLKRVVSNGNYHIDLRANHLIPKAELA